MIAKRDPIWHKAMRQIAPSHYNDRVLRPRRSIGEGVAPFSNKVAVFLIFPKHGVQESHIYALKYMLSHGYSPFVVSNLPLTDADIRLLQPFSWRIMQRENFGYDFGGYRDAVLDLEPLLKGLNFLVFLNDSTWFPIASGMDWLAKAEENSADLVAATHSGFAKKVKLKNYANAVWEISENPRGFHYSSFALSIKPAIFLSAGFMRYWKKLRLSRGKGRTIRRGEAGFSQFVIKAGHSHVALSDHRNFDMLLSRMSNADRRQLLRNVVFAQDKSAGAVFASVDAQSNFQTMDIKLVDALLYLITARIGLSAALPQVLLAHYNYSFLKKYGAMSGGVSYAILDDIIAKLDDPLKTIIQNETRLRR